MNNLYKFNNIAISHLTTVNLKMIKLLTMERKISDVLLFNKDASITLDDVYLIGDIEKLNEDLIKNQDNEYRCAVIIYENLVNVESVSLDFRFWTYLTTEVFHKYTLTKLENEKLTQQNYQKKVICKSANYKYIFDNYISRLWYIVNFCKKTDNKEILKKVFDNPMIIEEFFKSELFLYQIFLVNFIEVLFEEYEERKITLGQIKKLRKIFLMKASVSALDFYSKEDIRKIVNH